MTSANNFTIDGGLAPVDANLTFDKLKEWLAAGAEGRLEIAPLPDAPETPTQPALQVFFAAATELARNGEIAERLTPETLELCNRMLGNDALSKLRGLEAENG